MIIKRRALVAAIASIVALPAFAQEDTVEEVVVTGSYIRGPATDGASPVVVLDREDIEMTGAPDMATLMRSLTEYNGGDNQSFATATQTGIGGGGIANVSLRGLGPTATLVLLDGKRLPFVGKKLDNGERFVDIGNMPLGMIERVEVLKDGGSALYGSDAIAGVVNFITRRDYQGLEIRARVQDYDAAHAPETNIDAVYGWVSDSGNTQVTVGASYNEREPMYGNSRNDLFLDNYPGQGYGRIANRELYDPSICEANGYGTINTSGNQDGRCYRVSTGDFAIAEERNHSTAMINLEHSFSDALEVYAQYSWSEQDGGGHYPADTGAVVPTPIINIPLFQSVLGLNAAVGPDFFTNNPYTQANGGNDSPTGSAFFRQINHGVPGIDPNPLPNLGDSWQKDVRQQLGFRGDFEIMDRPWNYDLSVTDGESKYREYDYLMFKRQTELAYYGLGGVNCVPNGAVTVEEAGGNAALAADVAAARALVGGTFRSAFALAPGYPLADPDPMVLALTSTNQGDHSQGCYFWNDRLSRVDSTTPNLANPQELLDHVLGYQRVADAVTETRVYDFVVSGELFDLPAGPVAMAFGLQRREEERVNVRNPEMDGFVNSYGEQTGNDLNWGLYENANFTVNNDREIDAVFAEFSVPLHDTLSMQLAVRYEDYGGAVGDTTDPKVAFRWQPTEELVLRASAGTSFRGPSLSTLNEGTGFDGAAIFDPLADPLVRQGVVPRPDINDVDELPGLQFEEGLPTPTIKPEIADTYNFGFIWTPIGGSLEGLSFGVDYYDIQFEDKIINEPASVPIQMEAALFDAALAAGDFIDLTTGLPCAQGSSSNCEVNPASYSIGDSDAVPRQRYVNRIEGEIGILGVRAVNAGNVDTSGVDVNISYDWSNDWGQWRASWNTTKIFEYDVRNFPGVPDFDAAGRTNRTGETADLVRSMPDTQSFGTLSWASGDHFAALTTRRVEGYTDDDNNAVNRRLKSYQTWNARYGYIYDLGANGVLDFSVGVNDIFEEEPERIARGDIDTQVMDVRGRYFYGEVTYRF